MAVNHLSRLLNSLELSVREPHVIELLELNEKTKRFGLMLAPDDIRRLMAARHQVLRHYGRLELGIEATKEMIEAFSESPYISQDHYLSTLCELQEMFYDLKNETEDRIGDLELIGIMKELFDHECAGSLELLRGRLEAFAADFRIRAMRDELLGEGDDDA
jgi:hypothetical protein